MKALILLISLIWFPFSNTPQTYFLFSNGSKISINGTSTLHDWTMDTRNVKGNASIDVIEKEIISIKEINVEVPVESLKSGNNKMDRNAHEALKSNEHRFINFKLQGFEKIKRVNGKSALVVNGKLTIAGKTRNEKIKVDYSTDKNGTLAVIGSKEIKMTDYGVTPPEVIFGTVKTGNEITIHFELNLVQNSNSL